MLRDPLTAWSELVQTFRRGDPRPARADRLGGRGRRPGVEALEGRCLLSSFEWTDGAGNNKWTTAANWKLVGKATNKSMYPGQTSGDTATFPAALTKAGSTVGLDSALSLNRMVVSSPGTITLGKTLAILASYRQSDGTVAVVGDASFQNGAFARNGDFVVSGGTLTAANMTVDRGLFVQRGGTVTTNKTLTVTVGACQLTGGTLTAPKLVLDKSSFALDGGTLKNATVSTTLAGKDPTGMFNILNNKNTSVLDGVTLQLTAFMEKGGTVSIKNGLTGVWPNDTIAFNNGATASILGSQTITNSHFTFAGNARNTFEMSMGTTLTLNWVIFAGGTPNTVVIGSRSPRPATSPNAIVARQGLYLRDGLRISVEKFINQGSMEVTSSALNPQGSQMSVNQLTNQAGGDLEIWLNGDLTTDSATFANQGTINVGKKNLASAATLKMTTGAFQNGGTLNVNAQGNMTVKMTGTQANNSGALTVARGGTLGVTGGFLQEKGTTTVNGLMTIDRGFFLGGALKGSGTVKGNVSVAGAGAGNANAAGAEVDPGDVGTTGILTVDGPYTQSSPGALDVDLQNPTPGTGSDQLVVSGAIRLAGQLVVDTLPGFTGDSFTIIKNVGAGPVAGQFDGLPEDAQLTLDGRVFAITYHGDANHQDVALNVLTPAATTTTVTSDAPDAHAGQPVTFNATVTPAAGQSGPAPTGTVQFEVDGQDLGSPVPLSDGVATVAFAAAAAGTVVDAGGATATSEGIDTLAAGSHTVTVIYSGDARYATSMGTATQVVNPAQTAIKFTAGASTIVAGQANSYSSSLTVVAPGAPVIPLTGEVTMEDTFNGSTTPLVTLPIGQSGSFPALTTVGTHVLAIKYSGDANYDASTSNSVTVVVTAAVAT